MRSSLGALRGRAASRRRPPIPGAPHHGGGRVVRSHTLSAGPASSPPPEPRGGLRGRIRAAGLAPEAEMPQLQVVPGERVPRDEDLQRHPHVRRGTACARVGLGSGRLPAHAPNPATPVPGPQHAHVPAPFRGARPAPPQRAHRPEPRPLPRAPPRLRADPEPRRASAAPGRQACS